MEPLVADKGPRLKEIEPKPNRPHFMLLCIAAYSYGNLQCSPTVPQGCCYVYHVCPEKSL